MEKHKAAEGDMVLVEGVGGIMAVDYDHDEIHYGATWLVVDEVETDEDNEVTYWCSDDDGESYEVEGHMIDQVEKG